MSEQQIFDIFEGENDSYPMNNFQLTTTPNDFNVSTIVSFINSSVFKIPAFQRHYVWDIKRASKLIESLLIGLPIPQIFLYQKEKNEFLVIDGQQRLMTLYYFYNGRFPRKTKRNELREIFDEHGFIPKEIMNNDEYFQKFNLNLDSPFQSQPNRFHGLNTDTLAEHRMTLELATIRNMIIKPVADDEEHAAMFEIFNRLNSGGMNLTSQEIRMSMYHSKFNGHLLKLNSHEKWRELLGKPTEDLRLNDVEAILRCYAMLCYIEQYKTTISGFLNSYSNHIISYSQDQIDQLINIWEKFLVACENVSAEDFRTGGNRMSITFFESVFYAICKDAWQSGNNNFSLPTLTKEYIQRLKSDPEFTEHSTGKTTRRESVFGRTSRAYELLRAYGA
ncbi:DUF262 domain-containing protein [Vibrio cholerae]|uniref:DUF262 domain-containing protein n=1 Tax=Vibrio cholerae TaxID=666 RepID=UPI000F0B7049|nr:DUF262 domain-containing protein [Vibrio cholerae]EJL6953833.1 DUF262 domain-containing protein [Vibrio cholerae]RNE80300.1 DUF262 domain-containing protein [Vibrio cholerae]